LRHCKVFIFGDVECNLGLKLGGPRDRVACIDEETDKESVANEAEAEEAIVADLADEAYKAGEAGDLDELDEANKANATDEAVASNVAIEADVVEEAEIHTLNLTHY